jgi:hypothetical protein
MEKPVHRNKNYSPLIINSQKKYTFEKKTQIISWKKTQSVEAFWLLAFHIYDYTSKVFKNTVHI